MLQVGSFEVSESALANHFQSGRRGAQAHRPPLRVGEGIGDEVVVIQINSDSVDQDIEGEIEGDHIIVAAGSTYRYRLQIDRTTIPEEKRATRHSGEGSMPLTQGKYGLVFVLPLIMKAGGQQYSRILRAEGVTVSLE